MYNFKTSNLFLVNKNATEQIVINQGGTDCFSGDTKVVTKNGNINISDLKKGDLVLSFNEKTQKKEYKKVINVFNFKNNKKTIKLKLKNGHEIIVTEDHEFYFEGGWYSIKHLLSLYNGNMEKNTELFKIRGV
jgi:intein/homing endonuclease